MNWIHLGSYFFGGMFLANAIPHLVSGQMGRPFQSPSAKPSGEGSGAGGLLISITIARHFGRCHGGNDPKYPKVPSR